MNSPCRSKRVDLLVQSPKQVTDTLYCRLAARTDGCGLGFTPSAAVGELPRSPVKWVDVNCRRVNWGGMGVRPWASPAMREVDPWTSAGARHPIYRQESRQETAPRRNVAFHTTNHQPPLSHRLTIVRGLGHVGRRVASRRSAIRQLSAKRTSRGHRGPRPDATSARAPKGAPSPPSPGAAGPLAP